VRFTDELILPVAAGKGGDGSVHFARRKYQPFAGPDGGDGGRGGDVLLQGSRDVECLEHLRLAKARAEAGAPGGSNLMTGVDGKHCALEAPPGTLATDEATGAELGYIARSGQQLVVARGGKGGSGNPKYATGRRRAPKIAGPGKPGEERQLRLLYRIYCDSALIEPIEPTGLTLLAAISGKPLAELDTELFFRKPRWLRFELEFRRYDVAYLPLRTDVMGGIGQHQLMHLYWARHIFINLAHGGLAFERSWQELWECLQAIPLRRLEQLTVAVPRHFSWPQPLESQAGAVELQIFAADSPDSAYRGFAQQLVGGVID
jgi:hypothetical protein